VSVINSYRGLLIAACNYLFLLLSTVHPMHVEHQYLCSIFIFFLQFFTLMKISQIWAEYNEPTNFNSSNRLRHCGCLRTYIQRDQAIYSSSKRAPKSSTINWYQICSWVIWISLPIPSWRITVFNLSWSSLSTWDSRFLIIHCCGFFLVPLAALKSTCSVLTWLHNVHPLSHPVRFQLISNQLEMVE